MRDFDPTASEYISSGYVKRSRPRGAFYDPTAVIAGGSLVSGLIGADAASNAADTTSAATDRATASQRAMFDKVVELESPFRLAGQSALTKLSSLLGLSPESLSGAGGAAGGGAGQGAPSETEAQIRARLLPQFTSGGVPYGGEGSTYVPPTVDEAGLSSAIQAALARQSSAQAAGAGGPATGGGASDPQFGSLLKPFSMDDFQLDPGIQFQLKYGQQALQNSQAAKNGVLSGGALKDLLTFNQGLAGTGYQSAFDRYMATKGFTLKSLLDMSNLGQSAASNTAQTGPGFSRGIADTMVGSGQAQAAGQIGVANALSGGISGAGSSYLLSSLLKNQDLGGPITTSANPGGVYIAPAPTA